jgi:hypothetical protein
MKYVQEHQFINCFNKIETMNDKQLQIFSEYMTFISKSLEYEYKLISEKNKFNHEKEIMSSKLEELRLMIELEKSKANNMTLCNDKNN